MGSRFGGIPVEDASASVSKFGGVPYSEPGPHKTEADYESEHPDWKQSADLLGKGAVGVVKGLNPIQMVQGTANAVLHPIDTAKGIIALPAHLKQLYDEGKHEQLMDEIGQGLGNLILGKVAPKIPSAIAAAPEAISEAAGTAGTALRGAGEGLVAANKVPGVHIAAGASSFIPVLGHSLAGAIEGTNSAIGAFKGAKSALAARAAIENAVKAEQAAAAARATTVGRVSLADAAGIQPEAAQPIPAVQPDLMAAQAQQAQNLAARPSAAVNPVVAQRASLADVAGTAPEQPQVAPAVVPDIEAAKSQLAANLAARRPAVVQPTATFADLVKQSAPQTAADSELLNDLAQSLAKKPFARLSSVEQTAVRDLAAKGSTQAAEPKQISAPEAANRAAKVNDVAPLVKQALDKTGLTLDDLQRPEVRTALRKTLGISDTTLDSIEAKLRPPASPVPIRTATPEMEPEDYSELLRRSLELRKK